MKVPISVVEVQFIHNNRRQSMFFLDDLEPSLNSYRSTVLKLRPDADITCIVRKGGYANYLRAVNRYKSVLKELQN